MSIERTHDKIYLTEEYKVNPKEYFKLVYHEMHKDWGGAETFKKILDIGCATGEFLHYLKSQMPNAHLYGMDVMKELLTKVEAGIQTYCVDISNEAELPDEKFDICTMMGVLSIFDNHEQILDNVLKLFDEKVSLYLFGFFNPYDWDVFVKARDSRKHVVGEENTLEAGWNYLSKTSLVKYCEARNLKCEFVPFKVDFDIPKHEDDPLRSWTIGCGEDKLVVNGLQLIMDFYLCKIHS